MSDPTRFDLDDRQRAMLAEMGVRVWWPQRAAEGTADELPQVQAQAPAQATSIPSSVTAPAASLATPARRPVAPALAPAVVQKPAAEVLVGKPLAEGVDQMDWATLQSTVATCQACHLCAHRQQPVFGVGDVHADWMFIGDPQVEAEGQHGEPFVGQAKQLLDNMLKAVGVRRQGTSPSTDAIADLPEACLTHAVKCRPQNGRNPETSELATCAAYLSRQVTLVQPRVILAMGRFAIQSLLGSTEPMGKLRGRLHDFQGVPVVVTYPPSSLLRNPADKAKAWADLVLALSVAQG